MMQETIKNEFDNWIREIPTYVDELKQYNPTLDRSKEAQPDMPSSPSFLNSFGMSVCESMRVALSHLQARRVTSRRKTRARCSLRVAWTWALWAARKPKCCAFWTATMRWSTDK